ncbi:MAG: acyl-CoA thioesterase [Eudoraea sp.]|nr:acyl-CoA thioesterase [Eudoraea sp.]
MTFEITRVVTEEDLDDLDHVNNVRYVQWIQDISKEHWQSYAPEALRAQAIWVVKQHLIEYKNSAKLGDTIKISTYIKKSEGAISTRVVQMSNRQTNVPLLRSETEWCLLNASSLRPMRISEEIRSVFIDETST